jgi:hypothetical protein
MGPVTTAVVVYIGKRAVTRLVSGQMLRKGVPRKARRLMHMIFDMHVLRELMCDMIEDYFTSTW